MPNKAQIQPALHNGFLLQNDFIGEQQVQAIKNELEQYYAAQKTSGNLRHAEQKLSSVAKLAKSKHLLNSAQQYLSAQPRLVRTILFDKTMQNNWLVAWHQDKTIAVSKRLDLTNWGPWSCKENIQHVQPPLVVLDDMITFRIHLDDTDQHNGCLKVIPNSHTLGVIKQQAIPAVIAQYESVICAAQKGSALIMRPYLLHASCKSNSPRRRRVLHMEFSSYKLPNGLDWRAY